MKAIAYCRTSSSANVGRHNKELKDSKTRQKIAVEDYAKKNRLEIVKSFYDAGVPGKDALLQRKGFRELLKFCDETGVRTILVENASRFARDLIIQETGFQYLTGLGFKLIAVDNPKSFVEETPTSTLVRQILGSVSQFSKDELVSKLASARLRKRDFNKRNGKTTLVGLGKVEGRKSVQEKHPELVKIVRRLRRQNPISKKRASLRSISRELYSMGYMTGNGRAFGTNQIKNLLG